MIPMTGEEIPTTNVPAGMIDPMSPLIHKVVLISPPFIPLPPKGYAGIERVVVDEAIGLARRGWRVFVIAPTDSNFINPPENELGGFAIVVKTGETEFKSSFSASEDEYFKYWKPLVEGLVKEGYVIHDHTHSKHVYMLDNADKLPILSTIHDANPFGSLPPVRYPSFVAVSKRHARQLSMSLGVPIQHVYNGLDVSKFPLVTEKKDYAVFFSRISSIKGVHEAISIARECGVKLYVAGGDSFVDDHQYVMRVMRECDGKQIIYLGEVSEEKKVQLISEAKCMIFPTMFDEPFGIVVPEALACGTPVVTSNNGAMPEMIGNGVFHCDSRAEYVDYVRHIFDDKIVREYTPETCRRIAERFAVEKMVDEYERLLLKVGAGEKW